MSPVVFDCLGINNTLFLNFSNFFKRGNSIIVVATSILGFLFFSRLEIKYNPIINRLGAAAFSVYLIHENVLLKDYIWKRVLDVKKFQDSGWLILYLLFCVMLIYLMGIVVDSVYKFIYVHCIEKKVEMLASFWDTKLLAIWRDDDKNFSNGC